MTTQQEQLGKIFEIVDDYKEKYSNQDYITICDLFKSLWGTPQEDEGELNTIRAILNAERSLRKKAQREIYHLKHGKLLN